MSDRLKDMWQVLYNFLNKDESGLSEIFKIVDDFLCKEPSLLRPCSKKSLDSRFQDTFLIWLLNKLMRYLNDTFDEETHIRNVHMQKKILSSCLNNRPSLFEKLLSIYIESIGELAVSVDSDTVKIEIKSFSSEDSCLQEIDPEFRFQEIFIQIDDIDNRVQQILFILRHAIDIAFDSYPEKFVDSLDNVIRALNECEFQAKLSCLEYCRVVLSESYDVSERLNYFNVLTFNCCQQMWKQLPMWLHAQCVQSADLPRFASVTIALYTCEKATAYNPRDNLLIQFSTNILSYLIKSNLRNDFKEFLNFQELQGTIIEYMVRLQESSSSGILQTDQVDILLKMVHVEPRINRLFAFALAQFPTNMSTMDLILDYMIETLSGVFKNDEPLADSKILKEVLSSIAHVEQEKTHRKQLQMLQNILPGEDGAYKFATLKTVADDFNLFASNSVWTSQLNQYLNTYISNIGKILVKMTIAERVNVTEIMGLILRIEAILRHLNGKLQIKLFDFIQQPVRQLLAGTSNIDRELWYVSLETLSSIPIMLLDKSSYTYFSNEMIDIVHHLFVVSPAKHNEMIYAFLEFVTNFLANNSVSRKQITTQILPYLVKSSNSSVLHNTLKLLTCSSVEETTVIFQIRRRIKNEEKQRHHPLQFKIICLECENIQKGDFKDLLCKNSAVVLNNQSSGAPHDNELLGIIKRGLTSSFLNDPQYCYVLHHFNAEAININAFLDQNISEFHPKILEAILAKFSDDAKQRFLPKIARIVLRKTIQSLWKPDKEEQLKSLQLISCLTNLKSHRITEVWLFHFFKMTFFFLVHSESVVANEAVVCATEMCANYGIQPVCLWHCYKRDLLNLIVMLAVHVYVTKGVRLTRSLKAITKLLGFSCVQEFIGKYYRLLTTMILPYCVKAHICKGLIIGISKTNRKPIPTIFMASFLRIYSHIFLTETPEVGNKCIDLLVKCTGSSLSRLMHADVKQTVAEFLIYFNRNPEFVMRAFRCLLLSEGASDNMCTNSSEDFAKFIADRFLGVITYFESCLGEPNFEKPLKEEALYSLGQIIRFVGAQHVTQFRFKIIAMLTSVLTVCDKHLQRICLKIWNIFLHIVDIEALGPSLSRIVASLQPLLSENEVEVNAIYRFLIINNDSLLGTYIPDLYFIEHLEAVAPEIKQCVDRQTEILLKGERADTLEKLRFLHKQITNENLQVRVYGLTYLNEFISNHRNDINSLIMSGIELNPIVESVVEILVVGCKHEDHNLQLASAKCFGELGAIDPSYMTLNYTREQSREFSLSIHTDTFAIMALTELCRAYQFQKDTKYVDCFSLAIQEILLMCGVSPKENKKMNVWEAIPARMRQIMEPLLTSCYTGSCHENKCKEHPIFDSSFCRSYENWAFAWASKLIEFVQVEDTKHLLSSFKPSIRRDNNTLAIFFPYILLHALQDCGSDQMQDIYEEFHAVFTYTSQSSVSRSEFETSGLKEFNSKKLCVNNRNNRSEQYDLMQNISRTCTKLCSEQVDFLQRWMRDWNRINRTTESVAEKIYLRVEHFLKKFDKFLISKANYNSGEYARALMYLESHIEVNPADHLQEHISFLIEIHGQLADSDSVEGAVHMKKSNLNLAEEILVNRIVDRPQETMACYEHLMAHSDQIHQDHIKGMINCYLRMDIPETALLITDGLWCKLTDHYTDDYFKECKAELLWRLGRYDELEQLLEDSVVRKKTTNWNVQCAEAFLLFRQPQNLLSDFNAQLDKIRGNVLSTVRTCSGAKHNSYPQIYDEIIKLHLLSEVEKNRQLVNKLTDFAVSSEGDEAKRLCVAVADEFFADWDARLSILQPTVRVIEPILCFRRNLLIETKHSLEKVRRTVAAELNILDEVCELINTEIGKLWIRSVQLNREAGGLQQAHLSIMKAEEYQPKTLFIEKSKLLWQKGEQTNSLKLIADNLDKIERKCEGNIRSLGTIDRSLYAEAKFLQATFNAESMNICAELNLRYFKEAIIGNKQSEKCYVHYAQYMEKILDSLSAQQKESDNARGILFDIMLNYAKSMKFGCETVYQSLPRLLSIWLDYTSREDCATNPNINEMCKKMNDLITKCSEALPTSIFYSAFSQLLSRICHPSMEVFAVLRTIVISLVDKYPHQSLWMLLPIFKSSYTNRMKRCNMIFTDRRLSSKPTFQKLLKDFNMLVERLIELTDKQVPTDRSYKVSVLVKQLPRLFEDPNFSQILLPFEKFMQVSLPSAPQIPRHSRAVSLGVECSPQMQQEPVNAFPYRQIYITGIKEDIVVLRSQACPKKISFQCSDGVEYSVMVKPKDDLRKDFRLMEFNALLKRYLHQDSQARHRHLRIRTYAVIPFNEECGLIEWLPNLNTFRSIVTSIYKSRNLGMPDRTLKTFALAKSESAEKKRKVFVSVLLAKYPPVFHEWFKQQFTTPHCWYEARCAYVKTIAVMSMVGYILGLGDRHGENILFDETNGDAVHVDFNCLFNQGETFQYPELVPFRLTQNMVYAMGPLGVEGLYRKCCEITLRVLKVKTKTLLSVLRPFVYDLVAWNRNTTKMPSTTELTDPKAMRDMKRIEERLQGYVKRTVANSMPLSTEGQVNFLINEATDVDNLAAMYIGWGAYL